MVIKNTKGTITSRIWQEMVTFKVPEREPLSSDRKPETKELYPGLEFTSKWNIDEYCPQYISNGAGTYRRQNYVWTGRAKFTNGEFENYHKGVYWGIMPPLALKMQFVYELIRD